MVIYLKKWLSPQSEMGESDDVDGNTNQLESEGEGLVNKKLITPNRLLYLSQE